MKSNEIQYVHVYISCNISVGQNAISVQLSDTIAHILPKLHIESYDCIL